MFEVEQSHHGGDFKRFFSPGRSSMSAIENKRAGEFRRHVWEVTMIDEDPLSGHMDRHSTGFSRPSGPNKLRSRRRTSSACTALPQKKETEKHPSDNHPALETTPETTLETTLETTTMREPTIAVQPTHPASFGSVTELYPVREDSMDAFLSTSQPSSTRPHAPPSPCRSAYPAYSIYPGPETPPLIRSARSFDSMSPNALNRPRKLSDCSTATLSSMHSSRDSMRSASWGSRTSCDTYDTVESSARRRPDYLYQRPMPIKKQKPRAVKPNEVFAALPNEVLSLILENLKQLHLSRSSDSCATCWMRDVCSVALASRRWYKVARTALYEDIQLVGVDSVAHRKKFKLNQGARAVMLRRTLRANPRIAALVRSLKTPAPELPVKGSSVKKNSLVEYDNLVASLVMACPNLERLDGPSMIHDHSFRRLLHALSTRTKLKEMDWILQPSPHQLQQRIYSSTQNLGLVMPGELMPFQEQAFLEHHRNWARLETFSIHCLPGAALTPERLLTETLSHLPSLRHLHLCNLPPNGFTDANLLALPQLHTLTLSHITGITSNGLSTFATRSTSFSLRKLHLRHTPLTSLPALARILSNLQSLTNFALVQAYAPTMPEDDAFTLWMMPYLASSSLKKLHWDITGHSGCSNAADNILAQSIAAGGFPELRILRTLNDPDGIFQDLCYPVERIDLPTDRFRSPENVETCSVSSAINTSPKSPTKFFFRSSSQSSLPSTHTPPSPVSSRPPAFTNLHAARLKAQSRLERARHKPRFAVNVIEEDGTTVETFGLGGFIGTQGSKTKYHLLPDEGSSDEKGGLVDVRDLEGHGGEDLSGGREGCTGRWNRDEGVVTDKKEKEKWWHTERGRWTRLEL